MSVFLRLSLLAALAAISVAGKQYADQDLNELAKRGNSCCCRTCQKMAGSYCCNNDYSCTCACFPASSTVRLLDGRITNMTSLTVGDIITTVSSNGQIAPTEVLGFMKHQPSVEAPYRRITTSTGHEISLSDDHLIFAADSENFEARFAKDVSVGDFVQVFADGKSRIAEVVNVKIDLMEGAFVPLTKEGTLLVDGVHASCYAGFNHDLAHFFVTPMRWFPWLFDASLYAEGTSPYITRIMEIGRWLIPEGFQTKPNYAWQSLASTLFVQTEL